MLNSDGELEWGYGGVRVVIVFLNHNITQLLSCILLDYVSS